MKRLPLALLLLLAAAGACAQTTYRWIDAEGKVHFTDTPPPPGAGKKVETLKQDASPADTTPALSYEARKAAEEFPVRLYVTAGCDPCQQGRELLRRRGVPFAETDVGKPEGMAAMQAALGKDVQIVPVLSVGSHVAKQFEAQQWNSLLDAAGYPAAKAATAP